MAMAEQIKRLSTCSRRQVGVIVATEDLTSIVSVGYNGNYRGGPNSCDRNEQGNCGCLHAEDNALIKAPYGPRLTLFTTLSPCVACAKRIINSSVSKVVYRELYRNQEGIDLLKKADIVVYNLED